MASGHPRPYPATGNYVASNVVVYGERPEQKYYECRADLDGSGNAFGSTGVPLPEKPYKP